MIREMNVLRKTSLALAVTLLIVFTAACAPGAGQSTTGGVDKPAENVNLKDVDIDSDGNQATVTLSLLSGSRVAGYPESKLTQPPAYEISMLVQPYRLKVQLEDISFWDYEQKTAWDLSGLVSGLFREVPANDNSLVVYIQLSQEVSYTVEETEGSIVLQMTAGAANNGSSYYCVSDAFFEHQEGVWPEDIDMSPVLCSDKQNKLLISQAFPSQAAAESFQQQAAALLAKKLPDKTISVIQLAAGALPDFITDINYSSAEGRSVLLKDGVLVNTPVLLQNGRYLATSPNGTVAFSRVYQPGEPDVFLPSEKLWTLDINGRIQNVDTPEFSSIDKSAYSFDGRYLALLDVSIENRVLYVYDFTSGALINLGEEGFGSQTTSFAWSESEDALYAMSGYESLQLRKCFFAGDGSFVISAVEEQAGDEGNIAVFGQRVFFADSVAGKVYEIGETRRELTTGTDIRMSPDGKKLLVLETTASQNEQVLTSLKLCDIDSGETTLIASHAEIVDFCFSNNGLIYYTDASVDQPADGYSSGLYVFDTAAGGPPQLSALCSTPEIAFANGKLYFIDYIGEGNTGFYATYAYDPNAQ